MVSARGYRPPHVTRLLARLRSLDEPVIQLWAWPGSGQQSVLDALVSDDRREAQPLAVEELALPETLQRVVDVAHESGAKWLVLPSLTALPEGAMEALAGSLEAGRKLVFSAPVRSSAGPLPIAHLPPADFLLRQDELQLLWHEVVGREVGEGWARALLAATDGWYRPLRQVAESFADGDGLKYGVMGHPGVRSFLQHEVWAVLPEAVRAAAERIARADLTSQDLMEEVFEEPQRRALEELEDRWGLIFEAVGGRRLPMLFAAWLEESRAPDSEWLRGLADRAREQNRPLVALDLYRQAGADVAMAEMARAEWVSLAASLPLDLLADVAQALGSFGQRLETRLEVLRAGSRFEPTVATSDKGLNANEGLILRRIDGLLTGESSRRDGDESVPQPLVFLDRLARLEEGAAQTGDRDLAGEVVAALAGIDAPSDTPNLLVGAPGFPPLASLPQALAERTLQRLVRQRPHLIRALRRRPDLPSSWRGHLMRFEDENEPAAGDGPGFELRLFGAGWVRWRGSQEPVKWSLRRAFLIFAFLAARRDHRASREELEQAIWHDQPLEKIYNNFHPTLSHLRRSLKQVGASGVLQYDNGFYGLDPTLVWDLDVTRFERRVQRGREYLRNEQPEVAAAVLEDAWSLYRGSFLSAFHDPWILERRDDLQRLHLTMLSALGEAYQRLDRLQDAIDVLRSALFQDPLQEKVHLELMRIYARMGDRALVRRQYEMLTQHLEEDLGDEATSEFQRLMS
ncbi:MAG: BTAD domain-containing putative transcriptional regulator [Acidobacteriota bacterium]